MFDRKRKSIQVNTIGEVDHGKSRTRLEEHLTNNKVGKINCIWFTQDNGKLHPQIIPNLSIWIQEAKHCNFSVVLWTNKGHIQQSEIDALVEQKIIVRDHSEYKQSVLYPFFLQFLEKGIDGDKVAFALASDIFRMSILELTPEDEYFIYVDPNDITLSCLKEDLMNLPSRMKHNLLGFSFYAERLHQNLYHLRNDVLIALKKNNPIFFQDYLETYRQHIKNTQHCYVTPVSDEQAQDLARKITNQITDKFFKISGSGVVSAKFGNYIEPCSMLNSGRFIHSMRRIADGNTWLPTGECLHEKKMCGQFLKHGRIRIQPFKAQEHLNFDDMDVPQAKIIGTVHKELENTFLLEMLELWLQESIQELKMDLLMQYFEIYIKNSLIPSCKPWSALCAPPEKKLLTLPVSESTPTAFPKTPVSFIFWKNENQFSSENKCITSKHQEEYDKNFQELFNELKSEQIPGIDLSNC